VRFFCADELELKMDGRWIHSVYTDFSKAFDRVRHQLLLEEVSVGIEAARGLWIRSYLIGENSKDKNRRRRFQGYQGDIGCPTGKSSRIVESYLICQQIISEF
jgi:hypothetical protein